jgi:hypothetical protein
MNMSVAPSETCTEWMKIPKKMQHEFFELAEKEARRTKTKLLKDKARLLEICKLLKFMEVPANKEWENWRICVVDGSDSPVMSERVGGRFGAYGATYHIYEGLELVEEEYFSGQIVDSQTGNSEASKKMLSLLATCLEREVAVNCLDKDLDLLLIDGSFFGFRPNCRIIHGRKVPESGFNNGLELVKHTRDASIKLLESKKTVGIIKRVQTAAIDGWSIYKSGNDRLVLNRNDKEILSSLMKMKSWFSYESAFGDPTAFTYFSRLALAYDRYAVNSSRTMDSIFKACRNDVDRNIKRDLLCDPRKILNTKRYFVRCSYPAAPFCFETPADYEPGDLLGFFLDTCNRATGLPLPLDLTDQDVTMPAGFTQEFVEEIEANLVKDPDLDKYEIENHFASLNPQKQE